MALSSSIGRPSSPSANVDDFRPAPAAAAASGAGSRNAVDPLALGAAPANAANGGPPPDRGGGGDDSGDDDDGDDEMAARRGARRRVGRLQEDVPRVTDATGEAVMTSFQTFLETYVSPCFPVPSPAHLASKPLRRTIVACYACKRKQPLAASAIRRPRLTVPAVLRPAPSHVPAPATRPISPFQRRRPIPSLEMRAIRACITSSRSRCLRSTR